MIDKSKNQQSGKAAPQADRERELRDLIGQVEAEKNGDVRPANESANDFVERKMREKLKQ